MCGKWSDVSVPSEPTDGHYLSSEKKSGVCMRLHSTCARRSRRERYDVGREVWVLLRALAVVLPERSDRVTEV